MLYLSSEGRWDSPAIPTHHRSPLRFILAKLESLFLVIWVETEKKAKLTAPLIAARKPDIPLLCMRNRASEMARDSTERR